MSIIKTVIFDIFKKKLIKENIQKKICYWKIFKIFMSFKNKILLK